MTAYLLIINMKKKSHKICDENSEKNSAALVAQGPWYQIIFISY